MTHPTPPYARIAAELRRRIIEGELGPGEPVPSTRRLAREWHVALATATKALAVLRQDGLVVAKPRRGTVVASRAGRATSTGTGSRADPALRAASSAGGQGDAQPRASVGELTRQRVVEAAITLADAEGLPALSMRGVAARLGAATMAAYRHVQSKDELVLLMADAVLGELRLSQGSLTDAAASEPAGASDWRSQLELGARELWRLHRSHPWLAQIGPLSRPLLLPNLIAYSEWMLGALDGLGLPPATMLNVNALLYGHIQGIAIQWERESAAESTSGLSDEEWMTRQESTLATLVNSGRYPTFARTLGSLDEQGYDLRLDELFELGLTTMLDGIAGLIGEAGR